eukprot:TRINITY_DN82709_c0_g1_i1.p1 TRINITY_DN82709_c0_g1~~TRINITY_DN82709_c0_g1_i1.p1  ORF type:complete len:340 (+),score=96.09 TRINITY_DN82709_c0_g1_i1:97-1116(+)
MAAVQAIREKLQAMGGGGGGGGAPTSAAADWGAPAEEEELPPFQASESFIGARPGMVFKMGHLGLGYYLDPHQAKKPLIEEVRPKLPETWRKAHFREERLCVHEKHGCGLSMEPCEFGFAIDEVEATPGQKLHQGEVIVAIEGRILAGLSGPQMQASFHKRRINGARMHVAKLTQVKELSKRDPAIEEMWDAQKQHVYYFHKKTGQTAWTVEELMPAKGSAASGSGASGSEAAPIDLAHFLTHGFSKPKEPPKKKAKVKAKEGPQGDESDLAREERKRWNDWNEGGTGAYTENFFARYKNCQAFSNEKNKKDKRLKGSVGPGQGNEYMARWTGSSNSFN